MSEPTKEQLSDVWGLTRKVVDISRTSGLPPVGTLIAVSQALSYMFMANKVSLEDATTMLNDTLEKTYLKGPP